MDCAVFGTETSSRSVGGKSSKAIHLKLQTQNHWTSFPEAKSRIQFPNKLFRILSLILQDFDYSPDTRAWGALCLCSTESSRGESKCPLLFATISRAKNLNYNIHSFPPNKDMCKTEENLKLLSI